MSRLMLRLIVRSFCWSGSLSPALIARHATSPERQTLAPPHQQNGPSAVPPLVPLPPQSTLRQAREGRFLFHLPAPEPSGVGRNIFLALHEPVERPLFGTSQFRPPSIAANPMTNARIPPHVRSIQRFGFTRPNPPHAHETSHGYPGCCHGCNRP